VPILPNNPGLLTTAGHRSTALMALLSLTRTPHHVCSTITGKTANPKKGSLWGLTVHGLVHLQVQPIKQGNEYQKAKPAPRVLTIHLIQSSCSSSVTHADGSRMNGEEL